MYSTPVGAASAGNITSSKKDFQVSYQLLVHKFCRVQSESCYFGSQRIMKESNVSNVVVVMSSE